MDSTTRDRLIGFLETFLEKLENFDSGAKSVYSLKSLRVKVNEVIEELEFTK